MVCQQRSRRGQHRCADSADSSTRANAGRLICRLTEPCIGAQRMCDHEHVVACLILARRSAAAGASIGTHASAQTHAGCW
jgi:hypothetical protein